MTDETKAQKARTTEAPEAKDTPKAETADELAEGLDKAFDEGSDEMVADLKETMTKETKETPAEAGESDKAGEAASPAQEGDEDDPAQGETAEEKDESGGESEKDDDGEAVVAEAVERGISETRAKAFQEAGVLSDMLTEMDRQMIASSRSGERKGTEADVGEEADETPPEKQPKEQAKEKATDELEINEDDWEPEAFEVLTAMKGQLDTLTEQNKALQEQVKQPAEMSEQQAEQQFRQLADDIIKTVPDAIQDRFPKDASALLANPDPEAGKMFDRAFTAAMDLFEAEQARGKNVEFNDALLQRAIRAEFTDELIETAGKKAQNEVSDQLRDQQGRFLSPPARKNRSKAADPRAERRKNIDAALERHGFGPGQGAPESDDLAAFGE